MAGTDAGIMPEPLYRYVVAEAERLNVDSCPLAGHVIAACAASISDAWRIRPKRYDIWTQHPRLWVTVIKEVGCRGHRHARSTSVPRQPTSLMTVTHRRGCCVHMSCRLGRMRQASLIDAAQAAMTCPARGQGKRR